MCTPVHLFHLTCVLSSPSSCTSSSAFVLLLASCSLLVPRSLSKLVCLFCEFYVYIFKIIYVNICIKENSFCIFEHKNASNLNVYVIVNLDSTTTDVIADRGFVCLWQNSGFHASNLTHLSMI